MKIKRKLKKVAKTLELNKIHNMDCLEGLKFLPDNSIDSIVTDPPYNLTSVVKRFANTSVDDDNKTGKDCREGTNPYARTAKGFMGQEWDGSGIAFNVELWKEVLRVLKPGGHLLAFGGTRTYHRMACAIEDAGFEIRDQIQWIYGSGFPKSQNISKYIDKKAGVKGEVIGEIKTHDIRGNNLMEASQRKNKGSMVHQITAPATDEASQWEGWGTALKPANEPIVLARKPLSEKTIVENVLKWGTGGLNIDECRIGGEERINQYCKPKIGYKSEGDKHSGGAFSKEGSNIATGRFPANIILDEEAGEILDEQSGISKSTGGKGEKSKGASRFFYCPKASKNDRGEGNTHPTVKPVKLMEYLVTLVTPPNGVVLDPFIGSGTTVVACANLKCKFIGFELSKEYCAIANNRINGVKNNE